MNEQDRLDFLAALGEEFCTVLGPVVGSEICPQDGYEIFAKVLGKDFGPEVLGLLNASQIDELRAFGCTWLESPNITDNDMKEVVRRTLALNEFMEFKGVPAGPVHCFGEHISILPSRPFLHCFSESLMQSGARIGERHRVRVTCSRDCEHVGLTPRRSPVRVLGTQ